MRINWPLVGYLVLVTLILGIVLLAIVGEYSNLISCGWYRHITVKDIPARCLSQYTR